jgi:hypothetical protein
MFRAMKNFQEGPFCIYQALVALMDEAYTGSSTPDPGGDSGDEESASKDEAKALFADLLKDENDGLAVSYSLYHFNETTHQEGG